MATLNDLVTNLVAFENAVGTRGARQAAETMAAELQDAGPAWSGVFRNSWRILAGDVSPTPSIDSSGDYRLGDHPDPEPVVRPRAPIVSTGSRFTSFWTTNKTLYTITNLAIHREIAMDLVTGRFPAKRPTAVEDWFRIYLDGGRLQRTVTVAMDRALGGIL
jgi:hypothetical protein